MDVMNWPQPEPPLQLLSAGALNAIANLSEVRPTLGGDGVIDFGPMLAGPAVAVGDPDLGGWLFAPFSPGAWEVHTTVSPSGWGKWAKDCAALALDYAFTALPAMEVWTRAKRGSGAFGLANSLGGRVVWDGPCPGFSHPMAYMRVGWDAWAMRSERANAMGVAFHEAVDALGLPHVGVDDPWHYGPAGLGIMACQVAARTGIPLLAQRSAVAYNRMMSLVGGEHVPTMPLAQRPFTVDLVSATLIVELDGSWRVEPPPCREALSVGAALSQVRQ